MLSRLGAVGDRRRVGRRRRRRRLDRRRRDVVLSDVPQTLASQRRLLGRDDVVKGMLLDAVADRLQPEVPVLDRVRAHSEKSTKINNSGS